MAATYSIPQNYIAGFEKIISLSNEDLAIIGDLLRNLRVAENFENIFNKGKQASLSISGGDLQIIWRSLVSIAHIFIESNRDIEDFTEKFADSYLESKNDATEEDRVTLKRKLSFLLESYDKLLITVKSQELLLENQRNFRDCRVVTDIRTLFNEDLKSESKYALIVHELKIEYNEDDSSKKFFVALDLSDLKKMKIAIDRAIEKDKLVRDYQRHLNFIDF
ncbi:hypothetical protein ACFJIV_00470 [Mucilaginibacter sp. UC70_90]